MNNPGPTAAELRDELGRLERSRLEVHLAAAQHLGEAARILEEQYQGVLQALLRSETAATDGVGE